MASAGAPPRPACSNSQVDATLRFRARTAFVVLAILEAVTWAGLLVGMYLKHIAGTTEAGVWLFGRLHGAAFVGYVLATLVAARVLRWGWGTTLVALAASIPPLATVVFEVVARRRGLLDPQPTRVHVQALPSS